ncbi:alpha/beta hydrolase fold domain-containing protein [Nocardia rhamnosiphila]
MRSAPACAGLDQSRLRPDRDNARLCLDIPARRRPGPSEAKLRLVRELAVPPGTDPAAVSPIYAAGLGGLAPALVIVPTLDSLADHGRRYAQRLRESGTSADVAEHPGAPHAFVTLPGVASQAAAARRQITEFLRARLAAASPAGPAPARVR